MILRAACESALQSPNVVAFLRTIREKESSQIDDGPRSAFRMVNGGTYFQGDWSKHPYAGLKTTEGGRAAGAGQFIPSTWAEVAEQLHLEDFSPPNQLLAMVGRIAYRGALQDILDGDFDLAAVKCRKEWTSLPGASESRSDWTLDKARKFYLSWGGQLHNVPRESIVVPNVSESPALDPERKAMPAPLLLALAPMLAELIPQVAKLFSSGSEVSTRNIAAVQAVSDAVVTATNSANVQQAIEKMQADPALTQQVTQAVVTDPQIIGLLEVGGGIAAARDTGLKMQGDRTFLWNPLFWMSCILLPLASYVVFASVTGGHEKAPWWVGTGISAEAKVGIISSVISLIIGGICGIWFGTSYGSQRKDERAAQQ